MRIISSRSLKECWSLYPDSQVALGLWVERMKYNNFKNHQSLRLVFPDADYIANQEFRHLVIFNIKGNRYRLVVDIFFNTGHVFLKWFGPHDEYDKVNFSTFSNGGFRIC